MGTLMKGGRNLGWAVSHKRPAVVCRASHYPTRKLSNKTTQTKQGKDTREGAVGPADASSLFITPRSQDYSKWYLDVIAASEMAENSPVKGCMVIRPWGMAIWDQLREGLNLRIKAKGVQNAYFPVLLPLSNLEKEAHHVDGFAKECAVVTHHRLIKDPNGSGLIPDPEAKLEEPLVIRPTSETIIWDMYRRWVQSYRDLPIKINQWANVLRWEMRTRPFLRTAEFLWQEGHTAHATGQEAVEHSREMLDVYEESARELLAMPVVPGVKSPSERFAGAEETFTIEALMQNGWALQAGTSHFLGQNFAKAFGVSYLSKDGVQEFVWATSWGVSTRLIGALIMVHGDDKGVVIPPAVAPTQVVVVPLGLGKNQASDAVILAYADKIAGLLLKSNIRCHIDLRDHLKPGAKFYHWERRGVPLRIEIGPKEAEAKQVVLASRVTGTKRTVEFNEMSIGATITQELQHEQDQMYRQACARLAEGTRRISSYDEMKAHLDKGSAGFFLAPWTEDAEAEAQIQAECKATIRCYPFEHNGPGAVAGLKCFRSGRDATHMAIFARAF